MLPLLRHVWVLDHFLLTALIRTCASQLMSAEKDKVEAEEGFEKARKEFLSYRVEITRLKVRGPRG